MRVLRFGDFFLFPICHLNQMLLLQLLVSLPAAAAAAAAHPTVRRGREKRGRARQVLPLSVWWITNYVIFILYT